MRDPGRRRCTRLVVMVTLLAATLAAPARADVFLLKDGAKLHGWLEREYVDVHKQKWLSIRTSFGQVEVKTATLRKKLKSKKAGGALQLDEARFVAIRGDVRKSADGGQTWTKVVMAADPDGTADAAPFPPVLLAGEQLRTGADSGADLDLGFGPARVAADSQLELVAEAAATLRVTRGTLGASLSDLPTKAEFRVETPQASMGVRGTLFYVRVGESARFGVEHGAVEIRVGESVTLLGEGDAAEVAADGTVSTDSPDSDADAILVGLDDVLVYPRLEWVLVPGGRFEMGGPMGRLYLQNRSQWATTPTRRVTLGSFLMARHELTRARVSDLTRWVQANGVDALVRGAPQNTRPAPGRRKPWQPEPQADEPARLSFAWASAAAAWFGARLPSEAEWEYACRGGTKAAYGFGEQDTVGMEEYEWVLHTSGDSLLAQGDVDAFQAKYGMRNFPGYDELMAQNGCRPHAVGELKPSPMGLFDMIGNVSEWCADAAPATLQEVPEDGSPTPGDARAARSVRGATWESPALFEPHHRSAVHPNANIGVRLVRELR